MRLIACEDMSKKLKKNREEKKIIVNLFKKSGPYLFIAIWMFILGIFVGRGALSVIFTSEKKYDTAELLVFENEKEEKSHVKQEELGFYEDLKVAPEKTSETNPPCGKMFTIQVASFKNRNDAESLIKKLEKKGFGAYKTAESIQGKGVWHRVRIGSFCSGKEATKTIAKLKKEKLSPMLFEIEKDKDKEKKDG